LLKISPPDAVSRALGDLALVDPAFVVVEVLAGVMETGVLPQECRVELVQICARLPTMSEQLKYAVYMLLSANMSQAPAARNVVDMVFKSLEVCWSLLEATEGLLMGKRQDQFLRTAHTQE
jgi:hypothetical protein